MRHKVASTRELRGMSDFAKGSSYQAQFNFILSESSFRIYSLTPLSDFSLI